MITVQTLLLAALIVFGAAGCAHRQPKSAAPLPETSASDAPKPEDYGPPPPAAEGNHTPDEQSKIGPEPTPDFVPRVESNVLVLGPGLARAIAFAGVLRELDSRNVPIKGIVGVEMGALIGALWATSNQDNLEWEMHKLKRSTFLDMPLFRIGRGVAEGKRLRRFLEEAFRAGDLAKAKVPVLVSSALAREGGVIFESSGPPAEILRGALAIPGLMQLHHWRDQERETAALESPFPTDAARDMDGGRVICVDVLGRGDDFLAKDSAEEQLSALMRSTAAIARRQLESCDEVIKIPTEGFGYLSFDKKAELISRGRQAARRWLESKK